MPVTQELLDKIKQYEDQGYTPEEIVNGLSQSTNFPDVAEKAKSYMAGGYSHVEILGGMKASPVQSAGILSKAKDFFTGKPSNIAPPGTLAPDAITLPDEDQQTVAPPVATTTLPPPAPKGMPLPSQLAIPTPPTDATIGTQQPPTSIQSLNMPGAVKSTPVAPGMPTEPDRGGSVASGLTAIPEALARDASGMAAFPVGVVSGLARGGFGAAIGEKDAWQKGLDSANGAMEKLTYAPKQDAAKVANPIMAPVMGYDALVDAGIKEMGLSPEAAAATKLVSMGLMLAAPEAVRLGKTPLKTWYYGLSNKERGMIVLTYDDLKGRGWSDADLARKGFFKEELAKRMETEQGTEPSVSKPISSGAPPTGGDTLKEDLIDEPGYQPSEAAVNAREKTGQQEKTVEQMKAEKLAEIDRTEKEFGNRYSQQLKDVMDSGDKERIARFPSNITEWVKQGYHTAPEPVPSPKTIIESPTVTEPTEKPTPSPKKPSGPIAIGDLPTPEQSVGADRIAKLSDTQRNWLEGIKSALAGAEKKEFTSGRPGTDEEGAWTGSGFDHVREAFGLSDSFVFNRSKDFAAIQKALDGKKLGVAQAERVKEFLSAWHESTSRESDIVAGEPPSDGSPSDTSTGLPHLNNSNLLPGGRYKNWEEFLSEKGTLVEEVHGHKLYTTQSNLTAIVGPDGSIMVSPRQIAEESMTYLRDQGASPKIIIKGGMWEPVEDEVPFDRGGYAEKKSKPVQQGLDLGTKGEDLRAPKKESTHDAEDNPLFNAAREAKDREKQGTLFDQGGYDLSKVQVSLELPEIVRLTKKLIGKYPNINPGDIKTAVGVALGYFQPGGKKIVLSSNLPQIEGLVERVLAHELGHATDYSGDVETMGRGNILGRIGSLRKYMSDLLEEYPGAAGILTDADRKRLQKEAASIAKQESAERAGQKDALKEDSGFVSPEDILDVWRDVNAREKNKDLHDYIARLSDSEKKRIVKAAMKGISDITLKKAVDSGTSYTDLTARQKEIYQDLLHKEILKRNLYDKETVMAELKKLTQIIKPFDDTADAGNTKYRYSTQELYADAVSTMLTNPDLLKNTAPTFRKAFLNYLERKPAFKAEWERLQEASTSNRDQLLEERQKNTTEGYRIAEERIAAKQKEEKVPILHELYKALVEKNADVYAKEKEVRKRDGAIEDTQNPRYWVNELPYINGPIYVFLSDVNKFVMDPAKKLGITIDQIGEYFERMRAATERSEMANPGGMTEKTSLDALDKLKTDLGADKFKEIQKAYRKFQSAWQDHVISMAEDSGMWSDKLAEYARNNQNYSTFQHVMEFTGKLEEQLGPENTARVYRQIGTFQDIRNPFIATIMKGMALMRAAQINTSKRETIAFLAKNFGAETIQKARGTFTGKWTEYHAPKSDKVGMVTYLDRGKVRAYYVSKGIAESFDNEPHMAKVIMNVWNLMNIPLRNILVSRNPMWMVFNIPRDFIETWKNVPGLTVFGLLKRYAQAAPHAYKEVFKGQITPQVREMLQNRELVIERQYGSRDDTQNELDHLLKSFGMAPQRYNNLVVKALKGMWDFLGDLGKYTERISKIAGSLEMKSRVLKGEVGIKEKGHMVRSRIGTPDIHAGGSWKPLYNNIFLFSNVSVQGFRASYESFKEDPAGYMWKSAKYNMIPKVMMKLALAGLMGATLKKIYEGVSEYYMTNYQVIPLGLTKEGKSVVLTLPQDYTGSIMGAMAWKAMQGKMLGPKGMGAAIVSQSPYGLNPWISVGADAVTILEGRNPYDSFHGRTVVPEEVFRAKDHRTAEALLKYEAQQLGASAIYKFEADNPSKIKTGLEKVLDYPPGNILGRFLKVTDYGNKEKLQEVTSPAEVENARRNLDVKDAILESIKKNGATDEAAVEKTFNTLQESEKIKQGTTFRQFRAKYNRYASGRFDDAKIDAFIYARSSEEKGALLNHYKETLDAGKFETVFNQLVEEGYLKRGAIKQFNLLQEEGINGKR